MQPSSSPTYVTIDAAASGEATLTALLVSLVAGAILVIPSMIALYALPQRRPAQP